MYKNDLEKIIEPLKGEISKLTAVNKLFSKRDKSTQNFISKLKDFYGEKYNTWLKSILDHEKRNVSNDKSLKPK